MQKRVFKLNWRALIFLLALGLVGFFIYRGARDNSLPFLSTPTYQSRITYPTEPITLTYWRNEADSKTLDAILSDYHALHPNITIKLVDQPADKYDEMLTASLKASTMPDIFSVRNDWLPRYQSALVSAPTTVFTPQEYRDTYVDVLLRDLTTGDHINGVSFGVSTLGLFYNADMLAQADIKQPPKNWQKLADVAKKLTIKENGKLTRAGLALGTSAVPNYVDILSVLMMQNGARMTDSPPTKATFAEADDKGYNPGATALEYYMSFANSTKSAYSWNDGFGSALNAFAKGQVAMYIGYNTDIAWLNAQTQMPNYQVARLPQLSDQSPINYASHWDELVSKTSQHPELAWDLLRFISSREELNKYSIASNRPASRRDMADKQKTNLTFGVFAGQVDSAQTWYQGNNYNVAGIFTDLIGATAGGLDPVVSTRAAATRVTQEIVRSK